MSAAKFVLSASILLTGLCLAWYYLRRPSRSSPCGIARDDRPWRRVGAGISALLAVMFVLGVYVVDIPDRPVPYAIYWLIILGLVVWLVVLAVRDIMYTRAMIARWREEEAARFAGRMPTPAEPPEEPLS